MVVVLLTQNKNRTNSFFSLFFFRHVFIYKEWASVFLLSHWKWSQISNLHKMNTFCVALRCSQTLLSHGLFRSHARTFDETAMRLNCLEQWWPIHKSTREWEQVSAVITLPNWHNLFWSQILFQIACFHPLRYFRGAFVPFRVWEQLTSEQHLKQLSESLPAPEVGQGYVSSIKEDCRQMQVTCFNVWLCSRTI